MIDYIAVREMEERLMDEIHAEKHFSLRKLAKIIELQGLYTL